MFFKELTDEEWARLATVIQAEPSHPPRRGRPRATQRTVVNAVLWVLTTGERWSRLPARYPSLPTCRRRFDQWLADGTLAMMAGALTELGRTFAYLPEASIATPKISNAAVIEATDALRLRGAFWTTVAPEPCCAAPSNASRGGGLVASAFASHRTDMYRGYVIRATSVRSVRQAGAMFRAAAEISRDGKRVERSGLIGQPFDDSMVAEQFALEWAYRWVDCTETAAEPLDVRALHACTEPPSTEPVDAEPPVDASLAVVHPTSGIEPAGVSARDPEWLRRLIGRGSQSDNAS